MKAILTTILCAILYAANSQSVDYLDHNNTNVSLPRSGNFFYEPVNIAGFESPKNSGNQMMFSMQFYFMGKDANGTLRGSLGGPTTWGKDVFNGPYSNAASDPNYQQMWDDRAYQFCQEELDNYVYWFNACQGPNQDPQACANATVPSNATLTKIFDWPAHGNVTQGEDYWLAPFYDHPDSQQGVYDPENGDCPMIKGCCATWRVDNDAGGVHTMSGLDPLNIEMRYMTYQYKNFGLLNDVTFVEVELINRSNETYSEFAYGINADVFAQTSANNYIGSDSSKSLFYSYYEDDIHPTFGANSPVLGIVALNQPLTSVVDDQSTGTVMTIWEEMNGLRNGQPMLNLQGDTTKFIYHDNPNIQGGWSEEQLSNSISDLRVILSTEHGVFTPGEKITQTFAFVHVNNGTRLQNVDDMYAAADELHMFYDTIANAQCEGNLLSIDEINEPISVELSPNPASMATELFVDVEGLVEVRLIDVSGKLINQFSGTKYIDIDLSSVQNGAYLVQVLTERGSTTKKLIVDH